MDDAFIKICHMVNDLSMSVRREATGLLGSLHLVSPKFLEQTLDKKLMSHLKVSFCDKLWRPPVGRHVFLCPWWMIPWKFHFFPLFPIVAPKAFTCLYLCKYFTASFVPFRKSDQTFLVCGHRNNWPFKYRRLVFVCKTPWRSLRKLDETRRKITNYRSATSAYQFTF